MQGANMPRKPDFTYGASYEGLTASEYVAASPVLNTMVPSTYQEVASDDTVSIDIAREVYGLKEIDSALRCLAGVLAAIHSEPVADFGDLDELSSTCIAIATSCQTVLAIYNTKFIDNDPGDTFDGNDEDNE